MSGQNIVDLVRGLIDGSKGVTVPPYRVICPSGTNLGEHEEGENLALSERIKDIDPGIKEVVVGKGKGVSIENMSQEEENKHLTAPR